MSLKADSLFNVKDKVALVTGGTSGIGYMISKTLVQNGAKVYVSSRKVAECERVSKELTQMGPGSCHSLPADLVSEENCKQLVAQLEKKEKKLDILFNNAGATWGDTFESYPEAAWKKLYNLNVFSIFHLSRACLPLLENGATIQNPSKIINTSSIAGFTTTRFDNHFAYSSSKAAVLHLTRVLAMQFASKHITVNSIAPGVYPSRMSQFYLGDENARNVTISTIPLGRVGEEEDMGGLCLYLSSRASNFVTGTNFTTDGGFSISAKY